MNVCEFCGSRQCLAASPRRCRHTGADRTQPIRVAEKVLPEGICEFCGSRVCAKASPERCRHTGELRNPPAAEPDGLEKLTVPVLRQRAEAAGVAEFSSMRKPELIAAIREAAEAVPDEAEADEDAADDDRQEDVGDTDDE